MNISVRLNLIAKNGISLKKKYLASDDVYHADPMDCQFVEIGVKGEHWCYLGKYLDLIVYICFNVAIWGFHGE